MKKLGGFVAVILIAAAVFVSVPQSAQAAACANTSTYGAIRLFVPTVPRTGEFALWVRMQSSDVDGRIMTELNDNECLEVSSDSFIPNQWSWQPYRSGGQPGTVSINQTEGNTLKLIGVQSGIKVDRVILAEPDCVPKDFGNNCSSTTEVVLTDQDIQVLSPPSNNPINGLVVLSSTPSQNKDNLATLTYTTGGRTIQKANQPVPFDTTLVANGKHTIIIETSLRNGEVIRESTVIEVENPNNILSPIVRWLRLNKQSVLTVVSVFAGLAILISSIWLIRRIYSKRRERRFHGF